MQVQGSHALPKFFCRDGSISISVEESEGPSHIEALQEESCSYFVQDLVQAPLSEVSGLEVAAELLDVYLSDLLWVSNTPEKTMFLH
jgi:hypothetical protein